MKLEMQMTERDKKLLFFLGIFVVVVCFGWWGIRPAIKGISEANKKIEQAEAAKFIIDMKKAELPLIEVDNEKLEESIIEARKGYYPMMSSNEIDKMFTEMVLDYNLYAYDLDISLSDEATNLGAYHHSQKYLDDQQRAIEEEKARIEQSKNEEADETDIADAYYEYTQDVVAKTYDNSATGIHTAKVGMKIGGEKEDLMKLINSLSSSDMKLRVSSYVWDQVVSSTYSAAIDDYEVDSKNILYLYVEFYMCEE